MREKMDFAKNEECILFAPKTRAPEYLGSAANVLWASKQKLELFNDLRKAGTNPTDLAGVDSKQIQAEGLELRSLGVCTPIEFLSLEIGSLEEHCQITCMGMAVELIVKVGIQQRRAAAGVLIKPDLVHRGESETVALVEALKVLYSRGKFYVHASAK
jgi:hypothetical protein